jgi:hypothetical protein
MTAGILRKVQHLEILAQKQDRRLKDIHVWCQWATGKFNSDNSTDELTEYSGFTASQAYTSTDMRNLLHSSGSVLSLQIGDLCDDSVSIIWTPESASTISPCHVKSKLCPKQPTLGDLQRIQKVARANFLPATSENAMDRSQLQSLADIYTLAERSYKRRSNQKLTLPLCRGVEVAVLFGKLAGGIPMFSLLGSSEVFLAFEKVLARASNRSHHMIEDIGEIQNLILTMGHAGGDSEIEENLHEVKEAAWTALSEYMNHATQVFGDGKSTPSSALLKWCHTI